MGTSPKGVLQLLDSGQVTVTRQNICCRRVYAVSSYQTGTILRIKSKGPRGTRYHVKDDQNQMIAEFRLHHPWFKLPTLEIKMKHFPVVTVTPKSNSRSTLIMDQGGTQVLRVKHTRSFNNGKEYKILSRESTEIGSIRKDFFEYDLLYPLDLDVRYKTALIATIILNDITDNGADSL